MARSKVTPQFLDKLKDILSDGASSDHLVEALVGSRRLDDLTGVVGRARALSHPEEIILPEAKIQNDPVNHPPHYTQGGIECIDAIEAALGPEGFASFLRGQVLKYAWRMPHKGSSLQDAQKLGWYQKRLEDHLTKIQEG